MLPDTRTFFAYWDFGLSPRENLERFRSANLLSKRSRTRASDVLAVLRQRYLARQGVAEALAVMVQENASTSVTDRLFYYYSALSDRLLHDVVTELLLPLRWRGLELVSVAEVESRIRQWVDEVKTVRPWGRETIARAAQGVMVALRDFGVLSGQVKKSLAPTYLPIEAFAFISLDLKSGGLSGERLVNSFEWQLFFLQPSGVEALFVEAHQQHLLEYYAAGSVMRIDFPADSLREYAYALTERAH